MLSPIFNIDAMWHEVKWDDQLIFRKTDYMSAYLRIPYLTIVRIKSKQKEGV